MAERSGDTAFTRGETRKFPKTINREICEPRERIFPFAYFVYFAVENPDAKRRGAALPAAVQDALGLQSFSVKIPGAESSDEDDGFADNSF